MVRAGGHGHRKNARTAHTVIPAKAGTHSNGLVFSLGPRLRGGVTKGANWTVGSSQNPYSAIRIRGAGLGFEVAGDVVRGWRSGLGLRAARASPMIRSD